MPVHVKYEVPRLTQHEFAVVAYRVMATLFEIHEDFGRLFDEDIYQRELLERLPEAHGEVPIEVAFDTFRKSYYLDVLLRDLDVGLDLSLYRKAALHYCGPAEGVTDVEIRNAGGNSLGHQEQPLLSPEAALRISAIDEEYCKDFEHQLRCLLRHTSLKALQ
jgi:hypothetical protein